MPKAPSNYGAAISYLEQAVERWLRSEKAVFEHDVLASELTRARLDVLILEPFPLVLELKVLRSQPTFGIGPLLSIAKEFLAKRISVAQKYGKYMPFVAIVMALPSITSNQRGTSADSPRTQAYIADFFTRRVPAFDAVFTPEKLPKLSSLRKLTLNPLSVQVLERGAPESVELTSEEKIAKRWKNSISVGDLVQGGDTRPRQ
jgi:hypothetical protein